MHICVKNSQVPQIWLKIVHFVRHTLCKGTLLLIKVVEKYYENIYSQICLFCRYYCWFSASSFLFLLLSYGMAWLEKRRTLKKRHILWKQQKNKTNQWKAIHGFYCILAALLNAKKRAIRMHLFKMKPYSQGLQNRPSKWAFKMGPWGILYVMHRVKAYFASLQTSSRHNNYSTTGFF